MKKTSVLQYAQTCDFDAQSKQKLKMSDYALIMHGFDFRKSYDC